MKKKLIIVCLALFVHTSLSAQTVQFRSAEFENGVKVHIGLSESDHILISQLDTITQLNLSGIGLTDIRDVRFLSNLQKIDLSYNKIDDVSPLALLETLRQVDLCNNLLESINMLAFSNAEKMEIDVAFNYISDFSIFNSLTPCKFTIEGAGLQMEKNAPYFHVSYLYGDGTTDKPAIHYRVDATTTDQVQLLVGNSAIPIVADNQSQVFQLNGQPVGSTQKVVVTDNTFADSTFVVPFKEFNLNSLEQVTIETGLPDNYVIRFSTAQKGTLVIEDGKLYYNASATFDYEEIIYSYYWGPTLKGFSKIVLKSKDAPTSIDVVDDGQSNLEILLQGNQLCVKCAAKALGEESAIDVFDISGRLIASKIVNSSNGIDEQISLASVPRNVVVVQVTSGRQRFVDKIVVK